MSELIQVILVIFAGGVGAGVGVAIGMHFFPQKMQLTINNHLQDDREWPSIPPVTCTSSPKGDE